ncbi:hypothetical protein H2199_005047 [Coniosporium tulheliwenetii]|uniref:Uncharacterized protein n=1 Tax=Coniosporium tulheliwenetii TaxID=3383036 RepID=A0ACC2Z2S1_9PEZI|nr:hypothetical protein H2199_005047 [Cladosporium sp. JES 115]
MSTTQASTRYNYTPSHQKTWTDSFEMGKKAKAQRKLERQQAQQAQEAQQRNLKDEPNAQEPPPFVGQTLLDVLEKESSPHVGQALSDALEHRLAIDLAPSSGSTNGTSTAAGPVSVQKSAPQRTPAQPAPQPSHPSRPTPGPKVGLGHNNGSAGAPSLPPKPAPPRYELRSRHTQPVTGQKNVAGTSVYGHGYYPNYVPPFGQNGIQYPHASQLASQAQPVWNPQTPPFQPYYGLAPGGGVWLNPQSYAPLQPQMFQNFAQYNSFDPLRSVQSHSSGHVWRIDKNLRFSRAHSTIASPLATPSSVQPSTAKPKDKYAAAAAKRAAKRDAAQAVPPQAVPQGLNLHQATPERSPTPLPVPVPTQSYLDQASCEPKNLSTPQPMLFILDLNGTLLHRPNRKNPTKFVTRPFVTPFLNYLFAHFTVMVWSSARPENVSLMCAQLFTPAQRALLVAQWGRDRLGLSPQQYNNKVQVYKRLSQIWDDDDIARSHPGYLDGESWDQFNTVLLDDSHVKASSEPYNLVAIPEFVGTKEQAEGMCSGRLLGIWRC